MGIFRRRRRRGAPSPRDGEPDETFPFLTVGEAARLRAMVREMFAEEGIESEIHPGHLAAADGWHFGLHNLFATCHNTPGGERAWPGVVRAHVAKLARINAEPSPADLSVESLLSRAFIRVCGESTLPSVSGFRYRRRVGGDLIELLACDSPDAVAYLTDTEVERVGADRLRAAGVENLLTEPFGEIHWLDAPGSARFGVLLGDSVYTASRLLILDDVLRRATGDPVSPHGVLVSVPNRHQLAFHRLVDASLVGALEGMTRFTIDGFSDGVGGVSPHIYWRAPGGGELQQLTEIEKPGEVSVRVEGEFAEVVQTLLNRRGN
ncbi:MAG: hypothetical protein QG622_3586 [Actinomycetota bacterium]|nr:hypothetical protein [Actinomycetota bacterium]